MLRDADAARAAEQGLVHIISVDAIREAVGERWGRHQDLVEDFVIRSFRRTAREDDFIVRVNDADFILIQPGRSAVAALSRASQLMRETLSYFLGAVKAENIRISVVDRLQGDGIEATAVSPDEMARASLARASDLADAQDGSPPWELFGVTSVLRRAALVARPNASSLRVMFYLQPVWNVQKGAVAAFLIRSVVLEVSAAGELRPPDPEDLSARCHLELALRAMAFAEEVWTGSEGPPPALHLPIAFGGLTHSSARTRVIAQLTRMKAHGADRLLFVEVVDVPDALPLLTLSALVTQIKPFVRGVLARTRQPEDVASWRSSGLSGVVWAPSSEREADWRCANRLTTAARESRLAAAFYGVTTSAGLMRAWAAGFSHLSGDLVSKAYGDVSVARRFCPRDLYLSGAAR